MTTFHSSLAQLLQSNFINTHKSSTGTCREQYLGSLSDLTSERLSGKDDPSKCFPISDEASDTKTSNFNSLEEYTRSFLSNNNRSTFLSQKPLKESVARETETNIISERISNLEICDTSENNRRKIDLTAALLSSAPNTLPPSLPKCESLSTDCVFYPLKECSIDISALADEDILYGNDHLSNFGFVITKKWNRRRPLPKRKVGRSKPYDIGQCFKFDTPSPDDVALKARNRTTSSCKD